MNTSEREAYTSFFSNWYSEKISYNRGLAYFLLLDSRLRTIAGITDPRAPSPLDDIIIDLAQRRRREGVKILQKDFLEHLRKWFEGKLDYAEELQGMVAGKSIDLSGHFVASPINVLTETKYRVQQIGWDRGSDVNDAGFRLVSEVVPGSNAEKAGLKPGDPIIENTRGGWVQENPAQWYSIKTLRDGEELRIEWLPREDKEVPCWELRSFNGGPVPEFKSR